MKWIGQNIYDFISRFRSDVYLEDISTGTIASGAHLGLDSNNKIVKAVDGGGDLTSIVAGTGLTGSSLTSGDATINVIGGTGITANANDIALTNGLIADGSSITSVGTIGTGVWNATAIASAKMATGTASAQGALELATTGEADTGTDTARAVTPAGLKSHVDAHARKSVLRLGAFYINDNPLVQNSLYFGGSLGHQPMNWGVPAAVGGVIGDTASFTIANTYENWGLLLPFDISKIEVHCSLRPNLGQNDDITVAVYTGIRSNNSAAALTLTLAGHNSVAHSASVNRYTRNDVTVTANLNKGTMIYVGVGTEDSTNMKNGMGYMSITVTER